MKKETTLPFVHLQHQHQRHLPSTIIAFLALSLLISNVNALTISSLNDFINFTNTVNGGTSTFSGETVYLNTDLDMKSYSSSFAPVGNSTTNAKVFRGTFDGQGHVISNLTVSSGEFRYLGIFGYSYGATIKNLIVDSSCSFESNYSNGGSCATGGIIGHCESYYGECIVDNCVNMAQITYSGTNVQCIYIGGIVGKFTPHSYNISITNCVNYGNVSSVSSSLSLVRIGGIIGEMWTSSAYSITSNNTISNCVNFGSLYQSGELKYNLFIGGICGVDEPNIVYENCVDFGGMSYNTLTTYASIGSISGKSTNGTFRNCFWDEDLGLNATGKFSDDVKSEGNVESFNTLSLTGLELLNTLNNGGDNMWAVINFDSRGGSAVGPMLVFLTNTNKAAIPPPTPEKEGNSFGGWYSDEGLGTVFDTSTLKSGNITAYAKWIVNHYTITFTVDGVVYNESSQPYGSSIEYPPSNLTKEGFTFDGWYTDSSFANKAENNLTVSGNITLHGQFISTTVKIEFSTKDLSKDEMIKKIEKVARCTNCFIISEFKSDGDTAIIIVKFDNLDEAKYFYKTIQNDNSLLSNIKPIIRFVDNYSESVNSSVRHFMSTLLVFTI